LSNFRHDLAPFSFRRKGRPHKDNPVESQLVHNPAQISGDENDYRMVRNEDRVVGPVPQSIKEGLFEVLAGKFQVLQDDHGLSAAQPLIQIA